MQASREASIEQNRVLKIVLLSVPSWIHMNWRWTLEAQVDANNPDPAGHRPRTGVIRRGRILQYLGDPCDYRSQRRWSVPPNFPRSCARTGVGASPPFWRVSILKSGEEAGAVGGEHN